MTIHEKAKLGDFEGVKALIANGTYVDEKDEQGWTPLAHAAYQGHLIVVQYLLANGANTFEYYSNFMFNGINFQWDLYNNFINSDLELDGGTWKELKAPKIVRVCLKPDQNWLPAYLNQLKNTPHALDESTQAMKVNLTPKLKDIIIQFTFFTPSKSVRDKLAQYDKHLTDTKVSRFSCCNFL